MEFSGRAPSLLAEIPVQIHLRLKRILAGKCISLPETLESCQSRVDKVELEYNSIRHVRKVPKVWDFVKNAHRHCRVFAAWQ